MDLLLLLFLLFQTYFSVPILANTTIEENRCLEDRFLKPYLIVRQNKVGQEIAKLDTQGLIDLTETVNAYVCINGAAILYSDASIHKEASKTKVQSSGKGNQTHSKLTAGETVRYSNGSFKIFSHSCMHINRISKNEMEKAKSSGKKLGVTSGLAILGRKVTGIYLLTTKEPYSPTNPPFKIMLNRKALGYKIGAGENVIKDASFVAAGKGPYCLSMKDGSKIVLSSSAQDDKEICRWSRREKQEANKNYKRLLKRGHDKSYYSWEDCSPDIMDNQTTNGTDDDEHPQADISKPFAILLNSTTTSSTTNVNNATSTGNSTRQRDPNISSEEVTSPDNSKNVSAPVKYFIELNDCVAPPTYNPKDPLCDFLKPDNFDCEKLSAALELKEDSTNGNTNSSDAQQGNSKRSVPTTNARLTLEGNPILQWKHEVLSLVATIFSKICLPIRKQSVFQLMNVISNYIATAHTPDPEKYEPYSRYAKKTTVWDILISSLKRCVESNKTVPMQWEWFDTIKIPTVEVTNVTSAKKLRRRKRDATSIDASANSSTFDIGSLLRDFSHIVPAPNANVIGEKFRDEEKQKLIIQRSPPAFEFDEESTNDVVYRKMPRWKRQSPDLENINLPSIQEYTPPAISKDNSTASGGGERNLTYQDYIFHPAPSNMRIKRNTAKQIFYYEDVAQYMAELNKAIDAFWKVLASVMGFCQMNEISRGNAMYPLLLQNFDEYFLSLIKDQWMNPTIEEEVEMVLGEFLDEDRSRWLDTCLETAYIVSDSLIFRPARPLEVETMDSEGNLKLKENSFVQVPENIPDASEKYFVRKKILQ